MERVTPLTIAAMTLSKENAELTDNQAKHFSKSVLDYLAGTMSIADKVVAKNVIDKSPPFELHEYVEIKQRYLYKYVSEASAEYYRKGMFQVGSIGYFKKMENEKARDELEGLSFIATKMGNRIANIAVTMGFNYYMFCGTDQNNDNLTDYHSRNFGPVLLKIDLLPFAEEVAKRLGAKSFRVMKVKYANAKLIKSKLPFQITPEQFSNLGCPNMQSYLQHLVSDCTTPSLFTKPSWFNEEIETRIVFEMPYDVNQDLPKRFEHNGLLKYIQFFHKY
tara:strand:+ start:696 stop:1526 length:831 start_codon:yes stop_codon:yes gene_type:complete